MHRSLYHLKEGDPHAFAIPRLTGQAKASFVAIEFDEYGGGRGATRASATVRRLDGRRRTGSSSYLGYLDDVPADALASVNLMSLFGLHRELRGAAIGHFASTEITSSPGSRRLVDALERMGAPQACIGFYREHIEADAVHEQVVRTDVVGDLVARRAAVWIAMWCSVSGRETWSRNASPTHVMECWAQGRSSLRGPLVLTARFADGTGGWCRTADNSCCAGTHRSRP